MAFAFNWIVIADIFNTIQYAMHFKCYSIIALGIQTFFMFSKLDWHEVVEFFFLSNSAHTYKTFRRLEKSWIVNSKKKKIKLVVDLSKRRNTENFNLQCIFLLFVPLFSCVANSISASNKIFFFWHTIENDVAYVIHRCYEHFPTSDRFWFLFACCFAANKINIKNRNNQTKHKEIKQFDEM